MRMRPPRAAEAARTGRAGAGRRLGRLLAAAGGEARHLFRQPLGPTLRTGSSFPMTGADEDLGIGPAFPAMKLINRHGGKIAVQSFGVKANMGRISISCRYSADRKLSVPSPREPGDVSERIRQSTSRIDPHNPRAVPSPSPPHTCGGEGRGEEVRPHPNLLPLGEGTASIFEFTHDCPANPVARALKNDSRYFSLSSEERAGVRTSDLSDFLFSRSSSPRRSCKGRKKNRRARVTPLR
jgi:hypothetical protein